MNRGVERTELQEMPQLPALHVAVPDDGVGHTLYCLPQFWTSDAVPRQLEPDWKKPVPQEMPQTPFEQVAAPLVGIEQTLP